ncbi:MAG: hypothetical protein KA257_12965 [Opitutaceae bacterium]|nr:hypothetical protein [Opitutaceae bacterium]
MITRNKSPKNWRRGLALLVCLLAALRLDALSVEGLVADPRMNPKRFANEFESFEYQFFDYVQNPETFLRKRSGDCDDYAILADYVLKRKGFGTRLIHVRMVGRIAHAVCYVIENKAYLDYNNRKYSFNLERSGYTVREIADKVADSFRANWSSASAFTYDYKQDHKQAEFTVVKTESPAKDPDRGKPPISAPPSNPASS